MLISVRPARPGATPRWDARQWINQVWARDCGIKIRDLKYYDSSYNNRLLCKKNHLRNLSTFYILNNLLSEFFEVVDFI
jgi:hypothetical protein